MKIVKPTDPPSMAVVVDTIVTGIVELALTPADRSKDRIDTVYAGRGIFGVAVGTPAYASPLAPLPPPTMRTIAHIHIPHAINVILPNMIEEANMSDQIEHLWTGRSVALEHEGDALYMVIRCRCGYRMRGLISRDEAMVLSAVIARETALKKGKNQ